jgi:hypothetical protein
MDSMFLSQTNLEDPEGSEQINSKPSLGRNFHDCNVK